MRRDGSHIRMPIRNPKAPQVSTNVSSWLNFTPASINGLVCWFDATDTATITESSGAVSQWNDKSGNDYNVTQATGAAQPATGNRTINGLNVINFDGGDRLVSNFSITQLTTSKALSAFVLCQSDRTSAASEGFVSFHRSVSYDFTTGFVLERRTTFLAHTIGYGGVNQGQTNYNAARFSNSSLNPMIFTGTVSAAGNSKSARVDLVEQTLASFDGNMASSTFLSDSSANHAVTIGNRGGLTQPLDGAIGEVIVYNQQLDYNQLALVHRYLAKKWGIII